MVFLLDKWKRITSETRPMSPKDFSDSKRTGQLVSDEGAMNLEAHLQQPVEDSTVMKDLVTLRTLIESHTMTFYHRDNVAVNGAELEEHIEDKVVKDAPEDAAALASILLEPRSRAAGIQIVIARILFASIDFFGDPQKTLLSATAVSLMSQFRSRQRSAESQENYQLALARWRILATFLLPAQTKNLRFEASDIQARGMIDTMNCVLKHFIDREHATGRGKEKRENNLALIITRAARLGTMLFSQPTTWEFSWDMPTDLPKETSQKDIGKTTTRRQQLVVYPAIYKTSDPDGRVLPTAILIDWPKIDSFPVAISSTAMKTREDNVQSRGDPPRNRRKGCQEDQAIGDTTRAERAHEQEQSNSISIAATNLTRRREGSFSKPTEAERQNEQIQPLIFSSLSNREMHNSDQNFVSGAATADMLYEIDPPTAKLPHKETSEGDSNFATRPSASSAQASYEPRAPTRSHKEIPAAILRQGPESPTKTTKTEHNTSLGRRTSDPAPKRNKTHKPESRETEYAPRPTTAGGGPMVEQKHFARHKGGLNRKQQRQSSPRSRIWFWKV